MSPDNCRDETAGRIQPSRQLIHLCTQLKLMTSQRRTSDGRIIMHRKNTDLYAMSRDAQGATWDVYRGEPRNGGDKITGGCKGTDDVHSVWDALM